MHVFFLKGSSETTANQYGKAYSVYAIKALLLLVWLHKTVTSCKLAKTAQVSKNPPSTVAVSNCPLKNKPHAKNVLE